VNTKANPVITEISISSPWLTAAIPSIFKITQIASHQLQSKDLASLLVGQPTAFYRKIDFGI